jgi:hypothetical protein
VVKYENNSIRIRNFDELLKLFLSLNFNVRGDQENYVCTLSLIKAIEVYGDLSYFEGERQL